MGLRFKLDEHLPREAVRLLSSAGHDAHTVEQEGLAGSPDVNLIAACTREGRILVTLDLDFTDIRPVPPLMLRFRPDSQVDLAGAGCQNQLQGLGARRWSADRPSG